MSNTTLQARTGLSAPWSLRRRKLVSGMVCIVSTYININTRLSLCKQIYLSGEVKRGIGRAYLAKQQGNIRNGESCEIWRVPEVGVMLDDIDDK
jgi:hypothetical protein